MLQNLDPNQRFEMLMSEVSRQILSTDLSDGKIAEICNTSSEFVRRQRMFLLFEERLNLSVLLEEDQMPAKKIEISYEDLYREYIENQKTIAECAEFFGCSSGVVLRNMEEHGIETRPRGSSKKEGVSEDSEEMVTSESEMGESKESLETVKKRERLLERLVLLSAVKEASIQELLEEALELLFERYFRNIEEV